MTAKELAKKLNLSEAAVSMALNNKPGVSTATRSRVIDAAQQYGYDFSKLSTSPKAAGSIFLIYYRKHGAVLSDTPFFSELTEGVESHCRESGFQVNIKSIYDGDDIRKELEDIAFSGGSGIILLGTEMRQEDFKPLAFVDIPLVLLDNYFTSAKMDCVQINNVDGAYQATNYLIKKRRTQPGYLHSSYSISNFEERSDGFFKAVRYNGMSASKSIVHQLSPSMDGAYADMMALIESGEELASAYFADNDLIAAGAMKAFKEKGYRIPEDIGVIGFDNMPLCSYIEPNLTTISVPKKYMGQMAAERLISNIRTKNFYPIKIEVSTNLMKRQSL